MGVGFPPFLPLPTYPSQTLSFYHRGTLPLFGTGSTTPEARPGPGQAGWAVRAGPGTGGRAGRFGFWTWARPPYPFIWPPPCTGRISGPKWAPLEQAAPPGPGLCCCTAGVGWEAWGGGWCGTNLEVILHQVMLGPKRVASTGPAPPLDALQLPVCRVGVWGPEKLWVWGLKGQDGRARFDLLPPDDDFGRAPLGDLRVHTTRATLHKKRTRHFLGQKCLFGHEQQRRNTGLVGF